MCDMAKKKLDHDKPDRKWFIELYTETESYSYDEVITNLCEYFDEWAYIIHDKDINEKGEIKKVHVHFCGLTKTPRIRKNISTVTGVPETFIERAGTWKGVNRYLLHLDNPDKYQYGLYYVESNFDYCNLVNAKESESIKVKELIFYIRTECKGLVDLADYAVENNLWDAYRRNYSILKDYYFEINKERKNENGSI